MGLDKDVLTDNVVPYSRAFALTMCGISNVYCIYRRRQRYGVN